MRFGYKQIIPVLAAGAAAVAIAAAPTAMAEPAAVQQPPTTPVAVDADWHGGGWHGGGPGGGWHGGGPGGRWDLCGPGYWWDQAVGPDECLPVAPPPPQDLRSGQRPVVPPSP